MTRTPPAALALFPLAALAFPPPGAAQLFSPEQMRYMSADPQTDENVKECQEGVAVKMQYLYHMLRTDGSIPACDPNKPRAEWCACKPPWLDKALPEMHAKAVWQDPTEGTLSEAGIWQGPVSVLYEFFTVLQKTYPPEAGGAGVPPTQLMREFADNRTRFNMSLDRLYRARMGSSLGGRGRALLPNLDLVAKEYEALMDGLIRADVKQFTRSTLAIAKICDKTFREAYARPRGGEAPKEGPSGAVMSVLLSGLSVVLVFLAGLQLGNLNRDLIARRLEQYYADSQTWAQDFNKQFLTIKVHYLVLGPWIAFSVLGVLVFLQTFNVIPLFFLSGVGLVAGLRFPNWLLDQIRFRRGRQVEAQLIDAMTLLGNALKSGMDLVGGFRLVQKELLPPISEEFGLVLKNFDLGTPFGKALETLEERIDSRLLSYMIKAIIIQQQVGGNIIKIFDRIVENIREEAKLEEKTQSLTAQQRIQAIVVGIMPWVMVGIMFLFQGQQMAAFYFSPVGMITLVFCAGWIGIGMKVVSAMGNIKV